MIQLLFISVLLHIIDDFVLQPISLSKLKQKEFWKDYDKKYKNDYIMALFIHSLSWAIMISLPLIIYINTDTVYLMIIVNMLIHFIVDDLKANRLKINLIQDQSIHLLQLIITYLIVAISCIE